MSKGQVPSEALRFHTSRGSGIESLEILGEKIYTGSTDGLLQRMSDRIASGMPTLLLTLNVDQILNLQISADFETALHEASIRTLDGMPLVFMARMLGVKLVHRHTGADLLEICSAKSEEMGWRITIVGGGPGIAAVAAGNLRERYKTTNISGIDLPEANSDPALHWKAIEKLSELKPSIVFVCLGSPKQEKWYLNHASQLPSAVYVGSGAAVDFAAGRIKRSPVAIQRAGMEWAWRLSQEPRRLWRRYLLRGPRFVKIVAASLTENLIRR